MPVLRQIHILYPIAILFALMFTLGGTNFAIAATQQENLHGGIKDFEALTQDQKRGMWRDSWEKLEKRFATIEAQGKDYAAEAYFYQARSGEELAYRSKSKADYQAAAQLYKTFVTRYKKHPLADNACYNQAMLLSGPLGDKASAIKVLDFAITGYPDGDMFAEAVILRERLRPKASNSQGSAGGNYFANSASAWAGSASTASGQNLSTNSGQRNTASTSNVSRASSTTTPTPASSRNDLEKQKQLYAAAAAQWRTLLVDTKKGSQRESWLNLEKDFGAALKAAPNGPDAHKAAFQVARCREELAQRSSNQSDWKEAVDLFASMYEGYPSSNLADDSLYIQAEILAQRLKDKAGARAVLSTLLRNYPSGDMAPKARNLLNELSGTEQGKPASGGNASQPKPSARSSASSGNNSSSANSSNSASSTSTGNNSSSTSTGSSSSSTNNYSNSSDANSSNRTRNSSRASNGNSASIVEQLGLNIKTIMLDAGHGGKDPGAIGNGLRESTIALDLAQKLGAELKKKGFTVLYTREGDRFVELADRINLANSKKADIFVSIHVNASTNKALSGLETYYLDVARSDAARVVAAKENSVDVGRTSDLQFILSDLTRNSKKEESLALSTQVHKACMLRLKKLGFKTNDNGVRSAPFYVLMGARMPAFLVEVGYLSHSGEAAHIKNPKYIQGIANGITDGVIAYQKQLDKLGS